MDQWTRRMGVGGGKHAFPMSHLIQLGFIAFRCFKSRAIQPAVLTHCPQHKGRVKFIPSPKAHAKVATAPRFAAFHTSDTKHMLTSTIFQRNSIGESNKAAGSSYP